MRPLPTQPPGRGTSKPKHGEGTSVRWLLSGDTGGMGLRCRPPLPRGPRGGTLPPQPEPTSPTRPPLPFTALSRSPHFPSPNKTPPRPPRRRTTLPLTPPSVLRHPTWSSAWPARPQRPGTWWHFTAPLHSTASLQARRRERRPPRLARPLSGSAAHHDEQPIARSPPARSPAWSASLAQGGKLKTTRGGAHPGCLPLVTLPVRQRNLHSHWLAGGWGEQHLKGQGRAGVRL